MIGAGLVGASSALDRMVEALERLSPALRRSRSSQVEARLEIQRSRRLTLIDGVVTESATVDLCAGACGVPGEPRWFAASSDVVALDEALDAAGRAVPATTVPDRAPVVDHAGLRTPPVWAALKVVAEALARFHEVAREAAPAAHSYRSFYEDHWRIVWYGSADGTSIVQTFTDASLIATIRTRRLDRAGFAFVSRASSSPDALLSADAAVRAAAAQAERLLEVPAVEPGTTTVVLDPDMTGLLAHEALGHLCEADYLRERPEAAALLAPGRAVASPLLTVTDDPSRPGLRGSYRYDDEGSPARPTTLVEAGVVAGYLHSRATAAHFDAPPTGHARAQDSRYPPLVRMGNTFVDPGATPVDALIGDVTDGLYLTRPMGGEALMESFSFGANEVFRIRDGRLAERVGPVLLVGDLFETLAAIDAVGSDLAFETSAGGCAKEDQETLPVDSGGPHLRIRRGQVFPL